MCNKILKELRFFYCIVTEFTKLMTTGRFKISSFKYEK